MTESGSHISSYCGRCGNGIHAGERFCGNCGAPVSGSAESSNPRAPLLFVGIVVAVLVLIGVGTAAAFVFGDRLGFAGAPEPSQQPAPETPPEETTTTREKTEPTERDETTEQTGEGYELPEPSPEDRAEVPQEETFEQEFVTRYYDAVAAEDWYTTYSLLDSSSQAQFTESEWVEAQQARVAETGALPPTSATVQSASGDDAGFAGDILLTYSDGTSETVTIQTVYEAGGLRRYLSAEDVSYLRGLISDTEEPGSSLAEAMEMFVYEYYAAVEAEDWSRTYSMLDAGGQAAFSEAEWIERQEVRQAVSGPPSPVVDVSVVTPESGYPPVGTATVTFASGEVVEVTIADPHGEDRQFDRVLTEDEIDYLRSL